MICLVTNNPQNLNVLSQRQFTSHSDYSFGIGLWKEGSEVLCFTSKGSKLTEFPSSLQKQVRKGCRELTSVFQCLESRYLIIATKQLFYALRRRGE